MNYGRLHRYALVILLLWSMSMVGVGQLDLIFKDLKSRVDTARETMDRNLLDTLSAELIKMGETEYSELPLNHMA